MAWALPQNACWAGRRGPGVAQGGKVSRRELLADALVHLRQDSADRGCPTGVA